jgi:hypothetical protein
MRPLLPALLTVASLVACGPADPSPSFTDHDGGVVDSNACQSLGRARTDSESCCPQFGLDACGANLFCAALDGRTVPTCYPEYSRPAGATCGEDRQCLAGRCNTQQGKCTYATGFECDAALGCGSRDPLNPIAVCGGYPSSSGLDSTRLTCQARPVLGGECGVCFVAADCHSASLTCASGRCVGNSGATVTSSSCCLNGYTYSVAGGYRCA